MKISACSSGPAARRWLLRVAAAIVFASAVGLAQAPASGVGPAPTFEVVSIKPNASGAVQMIIRTPPSGLVTGTNVTAVMLIRFAHEMPDYRIIGAPAWASSTHFDVTARGPANAPAETTRAMIRALLADRFGAVLRVDARDMNMDVLVRAGRDLGPQLRISSGQCDDTVGSSGGERCGVRLGFGRLAGRDVSIGDVARALAVQERRHFVDESGLSGRYDLTLTYTPDAVVLTPAVRAEFPAIDPDGPSLGTALREQLGLRLQSRRGPVDVLVVEQVLPPSPD